MPLRFTTIPPPPTCGFVLAGDGPRSGAFDEEMGRRVRQLIYENYPTLDRVEHRRNLRFPFHHPIGLTPVDPDELTPLSDPVVVVGKDISQSGLGFHHQLPLPYRLAVVTLPLQETKGLTVLLQLMWCQFVREGWYETGGRFVGLVDRDRRAR